MLTVVQSKDMGSASDASIYFTSVLQGIEHRPMARDFPTHHRVQRHFTPLVNRSHFSPERQLTPPPLLSRMLFPITDDFRHPSEKATSSLSVDSSWEVEETVTPPEPAPKRVGVIPKPSGEVNRPGNNGYNLREALKWDEETYGQLQVRLESSILYTFLTDFFV
jgi:hypothetical protein